MCGNFVLVYAISWRARWVWSQSENGGEVAVGTGWRLDSRLIRNRGRIARQIAPSRTLAAAQGDRVLS